MVWHLVLLKPRADLAAGERRTLIDAFERALRAIPAVRDVRIGRRFTHGAAYEATAPDVDYCVSMAFDDEAGLRGYLADPAHQELGERFRQSVQAALVFDFDVVDLADVT